MSSPTPPPLDFNNVQGDILAGLPKRTQTYYFFQIDDARVQQFREQLAKLIPLITTTTQAVADRQKIADNKKNAKDGKPALLTMSGVNLAFTQKGLVKLGIIDDIGDDAFKKGMLADATTLGDQGTTLPSGEFDPDWIPAFKQDIHGLILISGESQVSVDRRKLEIERIFRVRTHSPTIHKVIRIIGDVRPGELKGHEHFGFLDGISDPAVQGFDTNPFPGQQTVRQGIVLLGREGDGVSRPPWALDGSFLAFRFLFQLVPEFDKFTKDNALSFPGLTREEGAELLGARLMGRWKSGAPIDITPLKDDKELAIDPNRNNNFRYDFPGDQQTQDRCPFAAHVRKTNPRADTEDLGFPNESRRIIRRGIQFGPEVSPEEAASATTQQGRGLIFAAYQSNIINGFQFMQNSWCNNTRFPPSKPVTPGHDPIVGQAADPKSRTISGTNPNMQETPLELSAQWVVPKGGEYLFSPSISALRDTFAVTAPRSEL